ncbi:MAG: PQQ-binding-like beta-propeller repeat protein, partial [Deltaproteobacteria bacterium]|nr:PQQ-binding-like beta-propeller repeat protein [Deltaproteobacteria bacterium]
MSRDNKISKRLLQGHPLFWAPIFSSDGNFYVSSGKGPGHSNLHAFTAEGELLWKSDPQTSLDDLDSYAIINAPVVDRNGHIYVGDINQLWAFYPDGKLKWVSDLTQYGIQYGFMTVVLSHKGSVGGISSNGKVIFLNAKDGKLKVPVLDLPGGQGPPAEDSPPRQLWADLMDPALKPIMFNLIQGWEMEVANTPALHPTLDRIYITAAGVEAGSGALYGIDLKKDRLEIAFTATMGGGSGTSPTVSHDGRQVYALDEAGHMVAIDAYTGKPLWETAEGGGGAASPSVGKDGRIYTASQSHLLAFRPDGSPDFNYAYDDFCADQIPAVSGLWKFIFSQPVAFIDSLLTISPKEGWLNIVCGHHLLLLPTKSKRTRVPIPLLSTIVPIDLNSGAPIGEPLIIPETSEGFILPTMDGGTIVTLSGAISSIYYHALNPLLPKRFEVPNEPQAGLLMLEPVSRADYARESLAWIREQSKAAHEKLSTEDRASALALLRETSLQRTATRATL